MAHRLDSSDTREQPRLLDQRNVPGACCAAAETVSHRPRATSSFFCSPTCRITLVGRHCATKQLPEEAFSNYSAGFFRGEDGPDWLAGDRESKACCVRRSRARRGAFEKRKRGCGQCPGYRSRVLEASGVGFARGNAAGGRRRICEIRVHG